MAKTSRRYSGAQKVAIVVGAIIAGLDAYGAFQGALKLENGELNYLVLAAPLIGAMACLLPWLAENARSENKRGAALALWAAFLMTAGYVGVSALERVATVQAQAIAQRQASNRPVTLARAALTKAEDDFKDAADARKVECDDGPGSKCRDKKAIEADARKRVDEARETLGSAGVEVATDPAAESLASMLPMLSPETVAKYRPALLPVTTLVLGFVLISYGASPRIETPTKKKATKKRRKAHKVPSVRKQGNVVPFQIAANDG